MVAGGARARAARAAADAVARRSRGRWPRATTRPWWLVAAPVRQSGALAGAAACLRSSALGARLLAHARRGRAGGRRRRPARRAVGAPPTRCWTRRRPSSRSAAAAYERSIAKLRGLLAREEPRWSPAERAPLRRAAGPLDEAIATSRERPAARRGDSAGNEQLFAAYQQKIDFLAEAVHRGGDLPPRGAVGA